MFGGNWNAVSPTPPRAGDADEQLGSQKLGVVTTYRLIYYQV